MKTDTQHLEYLISQYVDGCLDMASRKSLEQRLLNDPAARQLYKEQHDVQDVLDDWGNRIALINWDEFDQQLARRLENETVGGRTMSIFRRWGKPMSIAASLVIAATLGYSWHAWSVGKTIAINPTQPGQIHDLANRGVAVEAQVAATDGSVTKFRVDEQQTVPNPLAATAVNVTAPGNVEASESLKEGVGYGMTNLSDVARSNISQPGASSVHVAQGPLTSPMQKKDENPIPPAFP